MHALAASTTLIDGMLRGLPRKARRRVFFFGNFSPACDNCLLVLHKAQALPATADMPVSGAGIQGLLVSVRVRALAATRYQHADGRCIAWLQ